MRTMFPSEILTVRDGLFAAADPTTARRVTAESFILESRVRRENLKVCAVCEIMRKFELQKIGLLEEGKILIQEKVSRIQKTLRRFSIFGQYSSQS